MPEIAHNYTAIAAAMAASIVLGMLWYGPLFGKMWMKLVGMSEADMKKAKEKGMGKSYGVMLIATFVMACVLSLVLAAFDAATAKEAGMVGFWIWLGFVATTTVDGVLWKGESWKLWILNNAYRLIALKLMAVALVLV